MNTEEDTSDLRTYIAKGVKIAIGVLFFFLIPFATARNTFRVADRLSGLPGISEGGGIVSALAAFVYVFCVVGLVTAGAIVATGGETPVFGNASDQDTVNPAPPMTPVTDTTTPTPTAEPAPTPDSTATPEPTPETNSLEAFEQDYRDRVSATMQNDNYTGVPILATEYRENDQGQTVLWIVFWECDQSGPLAGQQISIANGYAHAVGNNFGQPPDRLQMYGVTNLVNFEDTTTYLETSEAKAAVDGNISEDTYTNYWSGRLHKPSQAVNETAYQMVVNESGQERADEAFYDDHVEVSGCPGGAVAVTPSD